MAIHLIAPFIALTLAGNMQVPQAESLQVLLNGKHWVELSSNGTDLLTFQNSLIRVSRCDRATVRRLIATYLREVEDLNKIVGGDSSSDKYGLKEDKLKFEIFARHYDVALLNRLIFWESFTSLGSQKRAAQPLENAWYLEKGAPVLRPCPAIVRAQWVVQDSLAEFDMLAKVSKQDAPHFPLKAPASKRKKQSRTTKSQSSSKGSSWISRRHKRDKSILISNVSINSGQNR